MSENEMRRYFDMFTECWKFFRRNASRMDEPEFWEQVGNDNCDTWARYEHGPLMRALLAAATKELERIYNRRSKE